MFNIISVDCVFLNLVYLDEHFQVNRLLIKYSKDFYHLDFHELDQ